MEQLISNLSILNINYLNNNLNENQNLILYLYLFSHTHWLNLDPCGICTASIVYMLILYGMWATSRAVIYPWMGFSIFGILNYALFNSLAIFCMYIHFKVMTTNPGAVPKDAKPLPNSDSGHENHNTETRSVNKLDESSHKQL